MCLNNVKDKAPSVAEEDIHCFKVIRDYGVEGGMYSPYMLHGPLVFGDLYKSRLGRPSFNQVSEGLHAMLTLESAKRLASYQFTTAFNEIFKTIIVNTIIPKGSEYYIGNLFTVDEDKVGIVANQMKYIDVCVQ